MEAEQKRSGEAMKGVRKYERKIKEVTYQVREYIRLYNSEISPAKDSTGLKWNRKYAKKRYETNALNCFRVRRKRRML